MKTVVRSSAELETDYHLQIETLGAGPESERRLVLVLDGDDQFAPLVEAARESNAGRPPLLVVGIGYGGGYRSPRNRRGRDYTPVALEHEPGGTGGAEAFRGFLETDLLPWLGAETGVPTADVLITGHSISALLVLHLLARGDGPFRRGLASSPSIWWAERAILGTWAHAHTAPPEGPPRRLFLSVGLEDTESMTGDLALLEADLARVPRPGLLHTVARFPGRDHYNVLGDAFRAGLAWLWKE